MTLSHDECPPLLKAMRRLIDSEPERCLEGSWARPRRREDLRSLRHRQGLRYRYGRDGFIRSVFPEIRAYFRRDFHPWDCANVHLVSEWSRDYGPYSKLMTP